MKILLLLLSLTTTAFSFPYSQGMGYPYNLCGDSRCGANNTNYNIQFTSNFGGNWQLTGKRSINKDGSYTDSFRGTVSDTSIQATVTRNDCDWLSDSYLALYAWIQGMHVILNDDQRRTSHRIRNVQTLMYADY